MAVPTMAELDARHRARIEREDPERAAATRAMHLLKGRNEDGTKGGPELDEKERARLEAVVADWRAKALAKKAPQEAT